jgi:hypothetical protein
MTGADEHEFAPGCCSRPREEHQGTVQEIREWNEWAGTEPGLEHRLAFRKAQLARLESLGAPEIILDEQRRMISEIEDRLAR